MTDQELIAEIRQRPWIVSGEKVTWLLEKLDTSQQNLEYAVRQHRDAWTQIQILEVKLATLQARETKLREALESLLGHFQRASTMGQCCAEEAAKAQAALE